MCRSRTCSRCGLATFAGCGAHVEEVLAGVPAGERCRCAHENRGAAGASDSGFRTRWFERRRERS
jgi:hypothetical protein